MVGEITDVRLRIKNLKGRSSRAGLHPEDMKRWVPHPENVERWVLHPENMERWVPNPENVERWVPHPENVERWVPHPENAEKFQEKKGPQGVCTAPPINVFCKIIYV